MPIPALATRVSRRPNRSTAVAISRRPSSGERTSISTATIRPGYSASRASSRSLRLAPTTTFAPAPGELARGRPADPGAGPGDGDDGVLQVFHRASLGHGPAARPVGGRRSVHSSPMTPGASAESPRSRGAPRPRAGAGLRSRPTAWPRRRRQRRDRGHGRHRRGVHRRAAQPPRPSSSPRLPRWSRAQSPWAARSTRRRRSSGTRRARSSRRSDASSTCRRKRSSPSWPRSTSAAGSLRNSHARSQSS